MMEQSQIGANSGEVLSKSGSRKIKSQQRPMVYSNTATKLLSKRKELYEAYESLENQKELFRM